MSNVVELADYQPAVSVQVGDTVHVLPESLIMKIVHGEIDITEIHEYQSLIRVIIADWYDSLPQESL